MTGLSCAHLQHCRGKGPCACVLPRLCYSASVLVCCPEIRIVMYLGGSQVASGCATSFQLLYVTYYWDSFHNHMESPKKVGMMMRNQVHIGMCCFLLVLIYLNDDVEEEEHRSHIGMWCLLESWGKQRGGRLNICDNSSTSICFLNISNFRRLFW